MEREGWVNKKEGKKGEVQMWRRKVERSGKREGGWREDYDSENEV